jgi:hypothetical protein
MDDEERSTEVPLTDGRLPPLERTPGHELDSALPVQAGHPHQDAPKPRVIQNLPISRYVETSRRAAM